MSADQTPTSDSSSQEPPAEWWLVSVDCHSNEPSGLFQAASEADAISQMNAATTRFASDPHINFIAFKVNGLLKEDGTFTCTLFYWEEGICVPMEGDDDEWDVEEDSGCFLANVNVGVSFIEEDGWQHLQNFIRQVDPVVGPFTVATVDVVPTLDPAPVEGSEDSN